MKDNTSALNINISAYRVLFILLMLVRYRSLDGMALNRLLLQNPRIGRAYNPETLTKYVNTLREAGCRIPRATSRNDYRYELLGNPFPLHLDDEEWMMLEKIREMLAGRTDMLLLQTYEEFLDRLSWCAADDLNLDESVSGASFLAVPAEDSPDKMAAVTENRFQPAAVFRLQKLLAQYQAYCRAAFTLEIVHREADRETHILLEPHSAVERDNRLWLLGADRRTQQPRALALDEILSVRQLPAKNRRKAMPVTVVFSLYGRLAGGYRLYPGEKILFRSDSELRIQARTPEVTGLTDRLFRYGDACQVISPDHLRHAMRRRIARLLEDDDLT